MDIVWIPTSLFDAIGRLAGIAFLSGPVVLGGLWIWWLTRTSISERFLPAAILASLLSVTCALVAGTGGFTIHGRSHDAASHTSCRSLFHARRCHGSRLRTHASAARSAAYEPPAITPVSIALCSSSSSLVAGAPTVRSARLRA